MRATIQKVSKAIVRVDGKPTASINTGLLILVGFENDEDENDIPWMTGKISNLRIFNDENDVMNLSIKQVKGDIIVVSQFTLHASTKKGNRPSYIKAAKPEIAIPLYETFVKQMELELDKVVGTGIFGANMEVELINDGPVTINIDSKNRE